MSLLLKFTDTSIDRSNLVFLLYEFRSCLTEQMIFIAFKKRSSQIFSDQRVWKQISWTGFPVPCSLMKTLQQVSHMLSALETDLTSSFLFSSDQLEYALHLLLSPVSLQQVSPKQLVFEMIRNPLDTVYTVVKPAFFVFLNLQDPSLECFPPSHNRNASVTGCRTSQHQLFQIHPCRRR